LALPLSLKSSTSTSRKTDPEFSSVKFLAGGNGDAHAKNFSILQNRDGEWRVAPAYDLPSTYLYQDYTMALPVRTPPSGDLGRGDFITLGADIGLRADAVQKILEQQAKRVDLWLPWTETVA
jgi:serine/threonine-protein kinase HipA